MLHVHDRLGEAVAEALADLDDSPRVEYMVDSLAAHFGPVLVVVGRHDDRLERRRSPLARAVVDTMAGTGG